MIDDKPMTNKTSSVTCFHDGECPLCEFEIKLMKRVDKSQSIQWVDISKDKEALATAGISYQQAMEKIHVLEGESMAVGVDGFIAIWKTLPYYRYLVPLVRLPLIYSLVKLTYQIFARYRLSLTGRKLKKEPL